MLLYMYALIFKQPFSFIEDYKTLKDLKKNKKYNIQI